MKPLKIISSCLFISALTGCQSPMSDMVNNNFVGTSPEPVPSILESTWTGSMGPYIVSMQWKPNGYGLFCYSYGTADVLQKVKFTNGEFLIQDGTKLKLGEHSKDKMIVRSPYFSGKDSVLYADSQLRNASAYCAKALSTAQ